MGRLLLLFIVLPAVELWTLVTLGARIGIPLTVALIVVTGLVGANLARRQGLQVLARVQAELAEGRLPAEPLVDGVIILVAAALLVTPGALTDVFGLACLVPGLRRIGKRWLRRRFERAVAEGRVAVEVHATRDAAGPIIDVTPEPDDPASRRRP